MFILLLCYNSNLLFHSKSLAIGKFLSCFLFPSSIFNHWFLFFERFNFGIHHGFSIHELKTICFFFSAVFTIVLSDFLASVNNLSNSCNISLLLYLFTSLTLSTLMILISTQLQPPTTVSMTSFLLLPGIALPLQY